ncbi:MAG TPA: cupin domain-containing protein [Solirubrobacterales bacterium]|nr:cupin domain-containing protein [Solirubrobacterales bacterium]
MARLPQPRLTGLLAIAFAFALAAILPRAFGQTAAEPTAHRTAMAQTAKVQGAPDRTMVLSKVVVDPGARLALHHHLGTQIARVQSGTLTYTVRRGSAVVRRGEADQDPALVRDVKAGQTARLTPGEWIVEQPSDIHEAANRGSAPVVLYLATLLKTGAAPSTPVTLSSRRR